jgi:hypothetical protein
MSDDFYDQLETASEALRSALYEKTPPEDPSNIYKRSSAVVEIIDRLRQVVEVIGRDVADVQAHTIELASDDDTSASEHTKTARGQLGEVEEGLSAASVAAHKAHSSLSHLKL